MTTRQIHILTHPIGTNYGGIMQAYALQQTLRKLEYEPITLDIPFDSRPIWQRVASVLFLSLKRIPHNQSSRAERIIQQHTNRFVEQYITRSPRLNNAAKLKQYYCEHPAYAYIVGSDQVWRQEFVPMLSDFFLEFIPATDSVRRIAYAASFGVDPIDISHSRIPLYASLLKRFVAVSVREQSAVPILEDQFDYPAQWTLDPTMLLTREEYIEHFGLRLKPSNEIFTYLLSYSSGKEELAQQIAQSRHAVYHLFSPWRHWAQKGAKLEECILPPVEEWLEGILNAECVVTDSFHGVAFSLIFGKPFVAIVNKHHGCSRFDTLMKEFGLERHKYGEYELISSPAEYDMETIAQSMSIHRDLSINFLQTALT